MKSTSMKQHEWFLYYLMDWVEATLRLVTLGKCAPNWSINYLMRKNIGYRKNK